MRRTSSNARVVVRPMRSNFLRHRSWIKWLMLVVSVAVGLFLAIQVGPVLWTVELFNASSARDSARVARALRCGADPNSRDPQDMTVLYSAVQGGLPDIAAMLLSAGADPNVESRHGGTPLEAAVRSDQYRIAEVLIQYGANPGVRGSDGNSLEKLASSHRMNELLKVAVARRPK